MSHKDITPMSLVNNSIQWLKLSNILVSTRKEPDHLNSISIPQNVFYVACNSIFLHSSGINELTVLHLQETYSLSVLMYVLHWNLLQDKSMNWVPVGTELYAGCLGITNGSRLLEFC